MRAPRTLAIVLAGVSLAAAAAAIDVPYLTGRIVDNAELLSAETRTRLGEQLAAHERATGNQIALLTVPTIGDASIEEYALAVFNSWKLGQKGKDNGVLVVVAPRERRLRIEVGYGLEGTLTDVQAARIIRDQMTPHFKEGNFERGIRDGIGAIIATLEGRAAPGADSAPAVAAHERRPHTDEFFGGLDLPWPARLLIGAFIFGIIGLFTFIGIVTPGAGWFLYFFLIPFWAMFPIVVLGVKGALYLFGTYVVGFPFAKLIVSRQPWYERARRDLKTKGRARIGGFTVSSASSGSSGGSSGGGFSGGGGSSGGGGASGSW